MEHIWVLLIYFGDLPEGLCGGVGRRGYHFNLLFHLPTLAGTQLVSRGFLLGAQRLETSSGQGKEAAQGAGGLLGDIQQEVTVPPWRWSSTGDLG